MKRIGAVLFVAFLFVAGCDSNDDQETGVCYCTFYRGEDQQYDYRSLSRAEQVTSCQENDRNAGNFGGSCKLK